MHVLVLHGGDTYDSYDEYIAELSDWKVTLDRFSQTDWKASLQESLGNNYQVILPKMPNKWNAQYLEWKIWFEKIVPLLDARIILVGHSLGGTFLAKYLSENTIPQSILSLHLVAAPYDDTDSDYSLASFTMTQPLTNVSNQCSNIYLYHSTDDPVVPFVDLAKYSAALPQAHTVELSDRLHIWQEEFSEIIENIRKHS